MNKDRKLLISLWDQIRVTNDLLDALESDGMDVDRIVRVSNAQGKPAAALHHLILAAQQIKPEMFDNDGQVRAKYQLESSKKSSSRKRKNNHKGGT